MLKKKKKKLMMKIQVRYKNKNNYIKKYIFFISKLRF